MCMINETNHPNFLNDNTQKRKGGKKITCPNPNPKPKSKPLLVAWNKLNKKRRNLERTLTLEKASPTSMTHSKMDEA